MPQITTAVKTAPTAVNGNEPKAPEAVKQNRRNFEDRWTLSRIFTHIVFFLISLTIIVPVIWVLVASFKEQSEFYGSPWTMPKGFYFQNYIDAFIDSGIGQSFLVSVIVTVMAMVISMSVAFCKCELYCRTNLSVANRC